MKELKRRIWVVFVVLVVALVAAQPVAGAWYPSTMVALGDSITTAYNTGSWPFTDARANSWSTGTTASVNSLYLRILAVNPPIGGKNYNYAVSGAKMSGLNSQAGKIASSTEYVTILIGANDVCTSSVSTMTSVDNFKLQFTTAMNTIVARAPNAKIYVVSIPDIYNLWSIFKDNASARTRWALYGICQSMLANPTSTKTADVQRRETVRQRNIDFNLALAQVCGQYANCRFDGNTVFNTKFTTADVSTRDYFHPSLAGQAKLALVAWSAAGLPFP